MSDPNDPKPEQKQLPADGASPPAEKLVDLINKEVGPLLPQASRKQALSKITAIVRREVHFQGPIPPPELFAGYENILPGSADRIMKMAEHTLAHNISVSVQGQKDESADRKLGMWLGFAALIVIIGAASGCALMGHPIFGGGLALAGVAGVVARFISGRANGEKPSPSA